jgi:hypothetical protein
MELNLGYDIDYAINIFKNEDKNATIESKKYIDESALPINKFPRLYTINGIGTKIYDDTLYFVVLFIPLFAIKRYSLERKNGNLFHFYGQLELFNWQILLNYLVSIIIFIILIMIFIYF